MKVAEDTPRVGTNTKLVGVCAVGVVLFLIAVTLWALGISAFRTSMGWSLFVLFVFGIALWWSVSKDPDPERARVWGDLGRSLLVAGLLAFAVWLVGELRRPIDARHNLQLTLGVQRALPGIDLRGEDLSEFDLARKDLRDARLSEADLSGATLVDANLSGAELADADLEGADLEGADLSEADLEGANLTGVSADLSDLRGARMPAADLTGAQLSGAEMQHTCLTGASLAGAYLPDAQLDGADLTEANLHDTRFTYDLRPADLRAVGLSGALFAGSAQWPPSIGDRYRELTHPSADVPPPGPTPRRLRSATVSVVADGDTLKLVPDGKGRPKPLRVRLIGVEAPDIGEVRGMEAREFLRQLLPGGAKVTYEYDVRRADKFGRRLMYVFAHNGSLVNQLIVERGRAVTAIDPPGEARSNTLYAPRLTAGETWARAHALGMWRSCPP